MDTYMRQSGTRTRCPEGSIITNKFGIPCSSVSDRFIEIHKDRLTLYPKTIMSCKEPTIAYSFSDGYFWMPRYYGLKLWEGATDLRHEGDALSSATHFKGILTPEQQALCDSSLVRLQQDDLHAAVLSMFCGYGKTVVALYLCLKLKRKCLVLVHTSILFDQWKSRIRQFLGTRAGSIKGSAVDVDADVVVCMLPSLWYRKYDESILSCFGTVIVDEAHHIPAQTFLKGLMKLQNLYSIGLTATPNRKDDLTDLIFWSIGPCICKITRKSSDNVTIKCIKYAHSHRNNRTRKGASALNASINDIVVNEGRNDLLVSIIQDLLLHGRRVIVLSERKVQLHFFLDKLTKSGNTACLYVSETSRAERKNKLWDCRCILSTWHMAKEGLDIQALDTLVMATPKSDVTQAIGRIQRDSCSKKSLLVVDIFDGDHSLLRHESKRMQYYKCVGFRIES